MSILPARVLLGTDGFGDAELAATTAVSLAKVTGSELHVAHVGPVVPEDFAPTDVEPARMQREARRILDEQVAKIEGMGGIIAEAHLRMGGVAEELVDLAEELDAGLIVVGSRGKGRIKRRLMGSVSDTVARHAPCPVLVVRGKPAVLPARILLATDGSEEANLAAKTAADLSGKTGSELHVVYVGEVRPVYHPERHGYLARYAQLQEEAQRRLEEQVEDVKASGATVADAHLRMGRPDEEIVVLGEEVGAGLIITGSRGLGGVGRALMGSVSDSVVRHAHCPVLVVRGE